MKTRIFPTLALALLFTCVSAQLPAQQLAQTQPLQVTQGRQQELTPPQPQPQEQPQEQLQPQPQPQEQPQEQPQAQASTRWVLDAQSHAIVLRDKSPHEDHIEMSGEQMAVVLRWSIAPNGAFGLERSLVFPMLRIIPNDTYGCLKHRTALDVLSLISVNGRTLQNEQIESLWLDGYMGVRSSFVAGRDSLQVERVVFPSVDRAFLGEIYSVTNSSNRPFVLYVPSFHQSFCTLAEKNINGPFIVATDLQGAGTFTVAPGESRSFSVSFGARRQSEQAQTPHISSSVAPEKTPHMTSSVALEKTPHMTSSVAPEKTPHMTSSVAPEKTPHISSSVAPEKMPHMTSSVAPEKTPNQVSDLEAAFAKRQAQVAAFTQSLVLETPDEVLDREFRFAKIRASESILKTAGGYMHAPGGEAYYAALWANDQAEYVNPFFPFLGYAIGNEQALNSYLHFARFMNPDYKPIPSSIIAEGLDIWDGAGDRGDAAMVAYGATRYLLARGSLAEARQLWPFVEWCLEYCRRQLNEEGVVRSDSDELEGRFPSGDANLCTSCLYYDALVSAQMLCRELRLGAKKINEYARQAATLGRNIEKYFGAQVSGFETYRYYEGNTLLRSWICMPLIVGLKDRIPGTVAALTSPALMTQDGLLTQEGSATFWDRSTLYAMRGLFIAGYPQTAYDFMHHYCERRLLGDHVPYPIEAWPEGSQRHLSAESGLFCRAITEGLLGLRPTSFTGFDLSPRLPGQWDRMALRHIKAFNADFSIEVTCADSRPAPQQDPSQGRRLTLLVTNHTTATTKTYHVKEGGTVSIKLQ